MNHSLAIVWRLHYAHRREADSGAAFDRALLPIWRSMVCSRPRVRQLFCVLWIVPLHSPWEYCRDSHCSDDAVVAFSVAIAAVIAAAAASVASAATAYAIWVGRTHCTVSAVHRFSSARLSMSMWMLHTVDGAQSGWGRDIGDGKRQMHTSVSVLAGSMQAISVYGNLARRPVQCQSMWP